jgi:hypothetical protein
MEENAPSKLASLLYGISDPDIDLESFRIATLGGLMERTTFRVAYRLCEAFSLRVLSKATIDHL